MKIKIANIDKIISDFRQYKPLKNVDYNGLKEKLRKLEYEDKDKFENIINKAEKRDYGGLESLL